MDYPKSVPSVGLVNGKFVDENPVTGQVGSLISSDWGNAVTDELLNVIRAGGKQPAEAEHDQLLAAIKAIVRDSIPPEKIRTTLAEYGITDAYTKSVTYTKAEIEALLKNMSALPVGAMVPFPKGTVPPGFLEVDGSVQSAATYPDLAAYLGTTFNTGGEGEGNFRLPESRGEFLRGWDHGRGVDAGRALGSWQTDELRSHKHALDANVVTETGSGYAGGIATDGNKYLTETAFSGGMETRPRNLAVMWCVKAWNAPVNQGAVDVSAMLLELQRVKVLAAIGDPQNLFVSASGQNSIVGIRARRLIVGSAGAASALSDVNVGINLLTNGLNGLDQGAVAASSWYSGWVATNGEVVAGVAALMPTITVNATAGSNVVTGIPSTALMRKGMAFAGGAFPPGTVVQSVDSANQITASHPATQTLGATPVVFVYEPVLPAGFTAVRVTSFFTDAANKYPLRYRQRGSKVKWLLAAGTNVVSNRLVAAGVVGSWNSTAPTWGEVSLVNFVPPTAVSVSLTAIASYNGGAQSNVCIASNSSYLGTRSSSAPQISTAIAGGTGSAPDVISAEVMLEGMSIYVASQTAAGAVAIHGYEEVL
ncbi:Phage Tail Collar Domain [Pseudomonas saponiphila]|uniref:Phage Tail Collar Domain n=1 Tax=Pseudomonas saponiphila TaxID=556534 RepID=A0A1H4XKS9_9PSED|nr:phage tail protein [Pseudomonas saponiphila]SED06125.1 Phage Tail Collar Domain [Pseudomonas saponiphila]